MTSEENRLGRPYEYGHPRSVGAGAVPRGSNAVSGVALPRRKRKNTLVDRWGRRRAAEDAVQAALPPRAVRYVLSNPSLYRGRFTDFHWAILVARNPRCHDGCGAWLEVQRTSYVVGKMIEDAEGQNYTGRSALIRQAERDAMVIVGEIVALYLPAKEKWHRIRSGHPRTVDGKPETLDARGRGVLDKFRKSKKGRQSIQLVEVYVPYDDVMDVWYDRDGEKHTHATRFSELHNSERRRQGLPEEDE